MAKYDFIKAGFKLVKAKIKENKILSFLKVIIPYVFKDNKINLNEINAIVLLPID